MMKVRPCERSHRRGWGRGGFSLIEVLVAAAIVGTGVTAIMVAMQTGTEVNAAGSGVTQAAYLAQEVREWTLWLPFTDPDPGDAGNPPGPDGIDPQVFVDDLDDLLDVTYSPPRDGNGTAMTNMAGWSQHVGLEWKDPDDLTTTVSPGSSDVVRVNVTISREGKTVLTCGWLVTRRTVQ